MRKSSCLPGELNGCQVPHSPHAYVWATVSGDIQITEEQAAALESVLLLDVPSNELRRKRKVSRLPYFLWSTLPIPYSFQESFPHYAREVVKLSLRMVEAETCVRFEGNSTARSRLEFRSGLGCSSFVGQMGGVQTVSIQTPACALPGIVSHELGHALGMFHEQGRPDQGAHIRVDFGNVHAVHWSNFLPQNPAIIDYYQQPYDLGSVMHYGPFGFALNEQKPAIMAKDVRYQSTIGQRRSLSFVDIAQINEAYCSEMCKPRKCYFGGYPDPNNCEVCKCPEGLGGDDCSDVEEGACGGKFTAYRDPDYISSPNYPLPMGKGISCAWLISAADMKGNVSVQFVDDFKFHCKTVCDDHFVEVKRGPDFRPTGYRFCCSERPELPISSHGDRILILLRVDAAEEFPSTGFRLRYWSSRSPPRPTFTKETFPPITSPPTTLATSPTPSLSTSTATSQTSTTTSLLSTVTKTTLPTTSHSTSSPSTTISVTTPRPPPTDPNTTTEPTTTTATGCGCSFWSGWSDCSQACGGCGSSSRRRSCASGQCPSVEKRKCGFFHCRQGPFLMGSGEFHVLWDGCCFGLVKTAEGLCGGLTGAFREFLSGLVSSSPSQANLLSKLQGFGR